MRVFVDVNIVLDVLLDRKPHSTASSAVWSAVEARRAEGFVAVHAVTTIYYFLRKELGIAKARRTIEMILRVFDVVPADRAAVEQALRLGCPDFEDAVSAAAASLAKCDYIVTRDPRGFRGSPVRALAPEAVVPLLG